MRFPHLCELFGKEIRRFDRLAGTKDESLLHPFWTLGTAKDGSPTAAAGSGRLHSAYNPVREAETFLAAQAQRIAQSDALVFMGAGLGYTLIEAARKFPQKSFLLVESAAERFFASLLALDWSIVFSLGDIAAAIACPPDEAIALINRHSIAKTAFLQQPPHTAHDAPYFSVLNALIERNRRKEEINEATLKKFGKRWERNIRANIETVRTLDGVNEYRGAFAGLPFLLLAAGPSLQETAPLLQPLSERMIVVCVDTALGASLQRGVEPDFIVLTDPQYWAYRHIAHLAAPSSILITQAAAYPAVFRFKCKKIVVSYSMLPVCPEYEAELLAKGDLGAGGSVASAAWNFAAAAGATEIYTAGLDFAYPSNQTHIRGSLFEQRAHGDSMRLEPAETRGLHTLLSANLCGGKDYDGNNVRTDARMKMFAWWFESRLAALPNVKTYTLSGSALAVPGITKTAAERALTLPVLPTR